MPFRRSPHFSVVLQPLTVVCRWLSWALTIRIAVKNGQHAARDNSLADVGDDGPPD
jgi:hypothetical protein